MQIATPSAPAKLAYDKQPNEQWLVAAGDRVQPGQTLCKSNAWQHAALAGTVTHRDETHLEIHVEDDRQPTLTLEPLELATASPRDILQRIRAAGVAGLGGGAFPTATKLLAAQRNAVRHVIINAVECEPGISCDAALIANDPDPVELGAQAIARLLATDALVAAYGPNTRLPDSPHWQAHAHREVHTPMGAERKLVAGVLGDEVPNDARPTDHGVVVLNVATVHAIGRAVSGHPLIDRVVTLPTGNVRLPIGAPLSDHVSPPFCIGGQMSGVPLQADAAVRKGTNAVWPAHHFADRPCIRCGDCDRACPELLPVMQLHLAARAAAEDRRVTPAQATDAAARCIECGLCNPVCPSDINVLAALRLAKADATNRANRRAAAERNAARAARRDARLAAQADKAEQDRRARLQRGRRSW